jgi:hypothetical protein
MLKEAGNRWLTRAAQNAWLVCLAMLIPASVRAADLSMAAPASPEGLAFARYIASLQERDPFTESGPVAVMIEASLPGLHKESRLLAIRQTGESERTEYQVLESEGDLAVTEQVIETYLAAQQQVEDLPVSSVAITPANYKFRYVGVAETEGAPAYVFRIVPKKNRYGLIRGELWIDSETGVAVVQAGHFVKASAPGARRIELVRDTQVQDGSVSTRITRAAVETRRSGRGYLTMIEVRPGAVPVLEPTGALARLAADSTRCSKNRSSCSTSLVTMANRKLAESPHMSTPMTLSTEPRLRHVGGSTTSPYPTVE